MHVHEEKPKEVICHARPGRPDAAYCALEQRRLIIAMVITGVTMILEAAGGLLSGSLALLSDAGHMFSHLFALGISYVAILLACRPATEAQSYGFYRAEILAALANGLTLLLIVAWILYEAWERLHHPSSISSGQMFIVAMIGLTVNAITALLLREASHRDINIRGAFVHVLGDMGSSVGVVVGAVLIWLTGWTPIDPIISILIALVILYWSAKLLWDAVRILLQSTPRELSHDAIAQALIENIAEIHDVHHIHVWELTTRMYVLTAHAEVDDLRLSQAEDIRERAQNLLAQRFCITHANIQFETKKAH